MCFFFNIHDVILNVIQEIKLNFKIYLQSSYEQLNYLLKNNQKYNFIYVWLTEI